MQLLYEAKQSADPSALEASYRNLAWRLKSIADMYNLQLSLAQNEAELLTQLAILQKGLADYHLPPQKIEQLKILKNWLKMFQAGVGEQDWTSYSAQLPDQLQFK